MEVMKSKLKVVWAVVAVVVLTALVADNAFAGGTWYYGYDAPGCVGTAYVITNSLGTIHREAAAGVLVSYTSSQDTSICLNMSVAG